MSVGPGKQIRK